MYGSVCVCMHVLQATVCWLAPFQALPGERSSWSLRLLDRASWKPLYESLWLLAWQLGPELRAWISPGLSCTQRGQLCPLGRHVVAPWTQSIPRFEVTGTLDGMRHVAPSLTSLMAMGPSK